VTSQFFQENTQLAHFLRLSLMVALLMSIISTKDSESFEHHHLLDLLLNDRPEDTQESVMFVLRMHNADGSVNLQKQ